MKVDIWSDVVCPWCYIGKRRIEKAVEAFDGEVVIEWHSFELDSSTPARLEGRLDELLAKKYRVGIDQARAMMARITENGAEEGLEFRFDIAQTGNTFDAHRVLQRAKESGVGDAMKERLMRAYFTEGLAISDRAELAALAAEVIPESSADEIEAMLETDAFAGAVRADEAEARAIGVTGVPFFVFDGQFGVSGAQSAETFELLMQQIQAKLDEAESCSVDGC